MQRVILLLGSCLTLTVAGCGTLTGIPSHGGGKRFATEQKLVSASIRNTLRAIDVSALRGHKAALIFDLRKYPPAKTRALGLEPPEAD